MRLRHSKNPLRHDWINHPEAKGILVDAYITTGFSKLRAKVLVFDHTKNLRHFWNECLGRGDLGKTCRGAVNSLIHEVQFFPGKGEKPRPPVLEADPNYFCVMGLVRGYLTTEIIAHESVHAGFAYAKRIKRTPWDQESKDMCEESVCYPAGRIAGAITSLLKKKGLISS